MDNKYSSFSQLKGLLWKEQFDGILNGELTPPIGAVIDLTDQCNFRCGWCNAHHFRSKHTLLTDHVKNIVDMLAEWGVKSVCYAGGGEPCLHPSFKEILQYSFEQGLEVGISTNGSKIDLPMAWYFIQYVRFLGVSVDAGTEATWKELKGGKKWDSFYRMLSSVGAVVQTHKIDYTFKFMIVPENQYEIYQACKLARDLMFKNFFVRPASYENVPGLTAPPFFDVHNIQAQIKKCKQLETDSFKVYGSFGRVTPELGRVLKFGKCRATPLIAVFCADGYSYLCIDMREQKKARLCKHLDLKNCWGTKAHLKLIDLIDLDGCPRCAFGHYNEQLEAYKEDVMYWKFP